MAEVTCMKVYPWQQNRLGREMLLGSLLQASVSIRSKPHRGLVFKVSPALFGIVWTSSSSTLRLPEDVLNFV